MKFVLSSKQSSTLSNFCNDIAKGLFLASFLGQGISENLDLASKNILSLIYLFFALLLLGIALLLDGRIKK